MFQLYRKASSQRPVEYRIASQIGEVSENDGVSLRQPPQLPRPPEQSSGYSRCEHNDSHRHDDLPAAWRRGCAHTRTAPPRCSIDTGDRCDEPIPASRQRLDKSRVIGGISQRLPPLVDRPFEAVVEIDHGISRPLLRALLFTYFPLRR